MCHSSIAPVRASCHMIGFVTMQLTYYRLNETLKLIFTKLNSLPIDELGNWYLKCWQEA